MVHDQLKYLVVDCLSLFVSSLDAVLDDVAWSLCLVIIYVDTQVLNQVRKALKCQQVAILSSLNQYKWVLWVKRLIKRHQVVKGLHVKLLSISNIFFSQALELGFTRSLWSYTIEHIHCEVPGFKTSSNKGYILDCVSHVTFRTQISDQWHSFPIVLIRGCTNNPHKHIIWVLISNGQVTFGLLNEPLDHI